MRLSARPLVLSLALMLFAFGADRLHKYVQVHVMGWPENYFRPVAPFFDLGLTFNTGISYGLLTALPLWALGVVIAVALGALVVWWVRAGSELVRAGLALAIGGALSNALDRLIYGAVADFFHFHWGDWSFYIFNIADVMISAGVVLLLLDLIGVGSSKPAAPPANPA